MSGSEREALSSPGSAPREDGRTGRGGRMETFLGLPAGEGLMPMTPLLASVTLLAAAAWTGGGASSCSMACVSWRRLGEVAWSRSVVRSSERWRLSSPSRGPPGLVTTARLVPTGAAALAALAASESVLRAGLSMCSVGSRGLTGRGADTSWGTGAEDRGPLDAT